MSDLSLQQFDFNGHSINVVMICGEPWFIASDICKILEIGNTSQACSTLKDREKGITNVDTLGGKQDVVLR